MVLKNVAYPEMEHYLTMKRYEVLMHTTTQMNFENIILSERGQSEYILHDTICMKCPESIYKNRK